MHERCPFGRHLGRITIESSGYTCLKLDARLLGVVVTKAFSKFRGDVRRVLKVCRACEFLLFSRAQACPVCNSTLKDLGSDTKEIDYPTLNQLAEPLLNTSDKNLRNLLREAENAEVSNLRFVNVAPDPFMTHFLIHAQRIGVCDFCQVIEAGTESKCSMCKRPKRFHLRENDFLLPRTRNLETAHENLSKRLLSDCIGEHQLMTVVAHHTVSDSWKKHSKNSLLTDFLVRYDLHDSDVEQFLLDLVELLSTCTEEDFENFLLPAEAKTMRLQPAQIYSTWSTNESVQEHWGPYPSESAPVALMGLYLRDYGAFLKGIHSVAAVRDAKKELLKKQRRDEEIQRQLNRLRERRELETLVSSRRREVSDWWLERPDDTEQPKAKTPYVARSWKNRWRRPS